jgi:hypothetical protein
MSYIQSNGDLIVSGKRATMLGRSEVVQRGAESTEVQKS